MHDVTILYRPVGPQELVLIEASGWIAFPPRKAEQPIFYPVLVGEIRLPETRHPVMIAPRTQKPEMAILVGVYNSVMGMALGTILTGVGIILV